MSDIEDAVSPYVEWELSWPKRSAGTAGVPLLKATGEFAVL